MRKNIKQKGSITVFLSLILVLITSFLFTSMEAARIKGGQAYLFMLSSLAGESFLASYYYPLFEQYGLLGVDAGYGSPYLSELQIKDGLQTELMYGVNEMRGGLLIMEEPELCLQGYKTLLTDSGQSFLDQVKTQAIYEGLEFTWTAILDQWNPKESQAAGELYQEQAELQEEAASTVAELLKLMTLVDGIATNEQGLEKDENGLLIAKTPFVKQMTSLSTEELSAMLGNEIVYQTVDEYFLSPQKTANQVETLLGTALWLEAQVNLMIQNIADCKSRISSIPSEIKIIKNQIKNWEKKIKAAEEDTDDPEAAVKMITKAEAAILECENQIDQLETEKENCETQKDIYESEKKVRQSELDDMIEQAKPIYQGLQEDMNSVLTAMTDALTVVDELEVKQMAAWAATAAYEVNLEGKEGELSGPLYQVLSEELNNLKLYLGMEEQGYSTKKMRETLTTNKELLTNLELPKFNKNDVMTMYLAISEVSHRISEYSLDGLWFSYGEVNAGASTGSSISATMRQLLATGVLELVGIQKDSLPKSEVSGVDLPSGGLRNSVGNNLLECMTAMQKMFSENGISSVFQAAADELSEDVMLELYLSGYFSDYLSERGKTRLSFEREYILFGNASDTENLCAMVLSLIAFRSVFTMTSLLLDTTRREAAGVLATALVGFTGIPILVYALKYTILLLWSMEEAIVETAAILQGKRIALYSKTGNVEIYELLLFTKQRIKSKADSITSSALGAGYSEYLTMLSLLEGTKKKSYRAMDLIQENIRLRYRDSFRIRNVVVNVGFLCKAKLTKKFPSTFFLASQYRLETNRSSSYE